MGTRPSALLGLSCEVTAFCWDRAVNRFGSHLEAELDAASEGKDSTKKIEQARERVFQKWMGPPKVPMSQQKFKDPMKRG